MTQTATETRTGTSRIEEPSWKGGVVAGLAGAAVMAVLMAVMNPAPLVGAIPSMYGLTPPSPAAGVALHLSHGAVLGVAFAALLGRTGRIDTGDRVQTVAAGVAWGVVTWVGLAALVMPVWLSVVGSPVSLPFPNLVPGSLLWHVVYGAVVGAVFPAVDGL
ncbi:histidine kinase [Haloglomus litoreum]|uniref:histidine kinase n=1 Tax=Haloglomus litoreum TaxID=3034026 RepID=UPI0023E79B1A|nr:histidine kinase [Haloglomus sp. DT116]